MPLEHWMEIAVLETLLDTWLEHKGARNPAHAALDREFRSALGPDFDISAFQSLDSATKVEAQTIATWSSLRNVAGNCSCLVYGSAFFVAPPGTHTPYCCCTSE
jgi:hypothetical protein